MEIERIIGQVNKLYNDNWAGIDVIQIFNEIDDRIANWKHPLYNNTIHQITRHILATELVGQNIITKNIPINKLKHIPNKAERLLAEKDYFNDNIEKFLTLGKREKEVLKLVAKGKSSPTIANELFISFQTVNTHRKSIKQKLAISSSYEFTLFAHAFDLI